MAGKGLAEADLVQDITKDTTSKSELQEDETIEEPVTDFFEAVKESAKENMEKAVEGIKKLVDIVPDAKPAL